MMDESSNYTEYREIRRRVEARLNQGQTLAAHLIVYLCGLVALVLPNVRLDYAFYGYENNTFVRADVYLGPEIGVIFVVWSVALLIHAGRVYRQSGATGAGREAAVEAEIRDRLAADDSLLLANRRQSIRASGLLNDDLRIRSGRVAIYVLTAMLNVFVWFNWLTAGGRMTDAWFGALTSGLVAPLLLLCVNSVARRRQERKRLRLLADWDAAVAPVKAKRSPLAEESDDDGELVDWDAGRYTSDEDKAKRN